MSWTIIYILVVFCIAILAIVFIVAIDLLIKGYKHRKARVRKCNIPYGYQYTYKNVIKKENRIQ